MAEPEFELKLAEEGAKFVDSPDKIDVKNLEDDKESAVPLHTPWTFWVDKAIQNASVSEYEANMQKVYTVSTVQNFWSVFNNIPDVSELSLRYAYYLMRGNRRPLWEDDCNRRGGAWKMKCYKPDTSHVWKELVLAIIGEQFADCVEPGDEICGLSVCVRETIDVIEIWHVESSLSGKATVWQKVTQLLPNVMFQNKFYKQHPVDKPTH